MVLPPKSKPANLRQAVAFSVDQPAQAAALRALAWLKDHTASSAPASARWKEVPCW
jgi:hypothetical protein